MPKVVFYCRDSLDNIRAMEYYRQDIEALRSLGHEVVVCNRYRDIPLAEFAAAVKEMGIESVELLDPADWPVVRAAGLTCAVANGTMRSAQDRHNARKSVL